MNNRLIERLAKAIERYRMDPLSLARAAIRAVRSHQKRSTDTARINWLADASVAEYNAMADNAFSLVESGATKTWSLRHAIDAAIKAEKSRDVAKPGDKRKP